MKQNLRAAYGKALEALGAANESIVALEADLGKSTMSCHFGAAYPNRYFQMGIAEQNMASVAAGMALAGKTPFIHSFAVFASGRTYDQIRSSICIPNLNVNICGSSAGLSDFGDGKTHQSIDDIAIMRVLPHMTVLSPADAWETEQMVKAMAEIPGPCYIRINRNDLPVLPHEAGEEYAVGQMKVVREGTDAVVLATGIMVHHALECAEAMQAEGVSVRVVNVSTIKPMNIEALKACVAGVKGIVTAEEHSIHGGLGAAVCEALSEEKLPIAILGIQDTFGTSAENYDLLLKRYKLMPADIAEKIRTIINK